MQSRRLIAWLALAGGCAGALTPSQRAEDAATRLASAIRFGRMDLALELVGHKSRERFSRDHAAWGSRARIVDCEIASMRLRDRDHADVVLAVSWNRVDESELRVTELTQRWSDHRGAWLLDAEERAGGDLGLLGEDTAIARRRVDPARFETITIR